MCTCMRARYITCVELLPTAGHLQSNSVLHRSSGASEEPCPRACYHLHSHSLIDFVFFRTYMLHCRQCCGDLKEPVRRTQGTLMVYSFLSLSGKPWGFSQGLRVSCVSLLEPAPPHGSSFIQRHGVPLSLADLECVCTACMWTRVLLYPE